MSDVTAKSTKAQILNAYENALATIDELKAQQFNPAEIKARETNKKAIEHTQAMSWDLDNMFAELRGRIDGSLRTVQHDLEAAKDELDKVNTAKSALCNELAEVQGIVADSNTFAALVEAQRAQKEQFETAMSERRAKLEAELDELRETIKREREEAAVEGARCREVWDYEYERAKKQRLDALDDEITAARREWSIKREAEEAQLAEREKAVAESEGELEDLRSEVDGIEEKIAAAEAEGKKKAGQSYGIEINALKRNHEADIKILNSQVASLREVKAEQDVKITALEAKLESAYEKIQGVASKALDAQGNYRTTAEVQRAVSAATAGKKA